MDNWMITLFQIIGGIGVFLLALDMLSQGLRMASGDAMKSILSRWTGSPAGGLFFGFAATAILQSSSVVTAIVISLVNAAIMPLYNAIWTIFGTNIGTTVTGWLISATGFDINLKALALPLIGIGMFMKIMIRRNVWRAAGMALTGIGLFFVGIDFLKDAFSVFTVNQDFSAINQSGLPSLLTLIAIGIVMTVTIQSSTASMVIILTAAASGMVTLSAGAALVIGANIGTTSTAIIAAIGASPNAKRTSATHVIFNFVSAGIVLAFLPFILNAIENIERWVGLVPTPAVSLAIFHTAFSVIGVIVFWPFVPALTRFLNTCFAEHAENDSKTKYLDRVSTGIPMMAINTMGRELARLQRKTAELCLDIFLQNSGNQSGRRKALQELSQQILEFGSTMTQENMDSVTAENLQAAFKINRHLNQSLIQSNALADCNTLLDDLPENSTAYRSVEKFMGRVKNLLTTATKDLRLPPRARQSLKKDYETAKQELLQAGLHDKRLLDRTGTMLDILSRSHRMAEQLVRADKNLAALHPQGEKPDDILPETVTE